MHDINFFEDNVKQVKDNLKKRNIDEKVIDQCLELNKERKKLIQIVERKKAEVKKISKHIGFLKKEKKDEKEISHIMESVAAVKLEIEKRDKELEDKKKELDALLASLPNLIGDDVPEGGDDSHNLLLKEWSGPPQFDFKPKDHVELGEYLGMLDFEVGAKITGSRFVVLKGNLARLERALINFMIDDHLKHGYQEIMVPYMVNSETLYGTGQLPKFKKDLFKLDGRDWYLIPTAEVPLTNLKKKELFSKDELPLKYCAFTPCFRSEAGSYGQDTRGLIRLHQFHKVELVHIVEPAQSQKSHEEMIERACHILEALELPYRMMLLCSGDTGFSARKCIDLEVWLPGQNKYREISSLSNCWDFQARRAKIRFRNRDGQGKKGRPEFAHTLNGSGLAIGRTLVAIMENCQRPDGSIRIPGKLVDYMGGIEIIAKSPLKS